MKGNIKSPQQISYQLLNTLTLKLVTRQECLLLLLFNIVPEILAIAVKQDKEEKRYRDQKEKAKLIVCSIPVFCGSQENPQQTIRLNKQFIQFTTKEISTQK